LQAAAEGARRRRRLTNRALHYYDAVVGVDVLWRGVFLL
jgi:hypothetical protein